MTIKTTFQATSRSGKVRTRITETVYTHAVDNGAEIVSFHQSFAAAQRAARKVRGIGSVVEAVEVERRTVERRQAKVDGDFPSLPLKLFAGKLFPGEDPIDFPIKVVEHWDSIGEQGWVKRTKPEIPTVGMMKEFLRAGLTKVALSDGRTTMDFNTEELTK